MQTILGSNGQIGQELARELSNNYTKEIRLVSRHPKRVNQEDQLVSANLKDYKQTLSAIKGSDIVYFTVGLPMNHQLWEADFPIILNNAIEACIKTDAKFVYFDNTYMYPKTTEIQTEKTNFNPVGKKSVIRANMATTVLTAIKNGKINGLICRAPEFFGPDKTQSITNQLIFNRIKSGKRALIPVSSHTIRSLTWTPDASRATALLANTPSAYGQTWHLPSIQITYQALLDHNSSITQQSITSMTIPKVVFNIGRLFSKQFRELWELVPRYVSDNLFSDEKFYAAFPNFKGTTIDDGIKEIFTISH